MTTQGYSPGPWEVHHGFDVTGYPCFYIHGLSGEQKRDKSALEANAHLIAAAPDLAEALEDVCLRVTQAKMASRIGKKKDRTEFLLGELDRIAEQVMAALAKAGR